MAPPTSGMCPAAFGLGATSVVRNATRRACRREALLITAHTLPDHSQQDVADRWAEDAPYEPLARSLARHTVAERRGIGGYVEASASTSRDVVGEVGKRGAVFDSMLLR